MPKNKSLAYQVKEVLSQKLRIGEPKHLAKKQGVAFEGIYSWNTYKNYLTKSSAFARWAKEHFECRTLEQARPHVDAYLRHHIDQGSRDFPHLLRKAKYASGK